jgi:excinuclease ABC subunit C
VVVDGGLGQLSAAIKGLKKSGFTPLQISDDAPSENSAYPEVAICALAKREELVYVPGKSSPVNNSADSPALLLLRALRDESHRFALFAHRKQRSILKSSL